MTKKNSHTSRKDPDPGRDDAMAASRDDDVTQVHTDESTQLYGDDITPSQKKRSRHPVSQIEIDPKFMNDPPRMQYALLLALLIRSGGSVRFSAKDMEPVDTDHNIVFARTLDGTRLEVTVVSAESGMIRSPEREKEASSWQQRESSTLYNPMPPSIPADLAEDVRQLYLKNLAAIAQQARTTGPPATDSPVVLPFPNAPNFPEMPEHLKPRDGSAPYQFPFETGSSPTTATPGDLSSLQQKLLQTERQVLHEEAMAIAAQEGM